jgi:hypothetical protein
MDWIDLPLKPRLLGIPSCASKMISVLVVRSAKPFTYLASRLALYKMNWVKHPLELRHVGVLSGASQTISEPMVCLAQTVHLSCADPNTVFKWTKTRFHMTHFTLEFHWVRPKQFYDVVVCSAQNVHLSSVKISTIFERSELSFDLSLVT